ncbi:MAG: DUF5794 domain-containing protein [Haloferacaceae archaeon]
MSVSQHPIALRVEQHVGGATRLLATVMALPLIDGIFPALVIAGALSTPFGLLETGLLIFGGSATMAVILAEMEGTHREQALSILVIGAVLIPVAAAEAALAMTFDSVLNLEIFRRFAGLVILAIAAKTASSKLDEYLPGAGVIIALGLVASVEPDGAALQLSTDLGVVLRGAAAAAVGVGFALSVALLGPHLRGRVDLDRFRFGSAVALGVLALPILGVLDTDAPIALAVLVVTAMLAYDPDSTPAPTPGSAGGSDDPDPDVPAGAPGGGETEQSGPTPASVTASSLRLDGDATPADREIAARGAVAGGYPGVNRHSSGGGSPTRVSNGGVVRSEGDRVRPDPDRVDEPVGDTVDDTAGDDPDPDYPDAEDPATPGEDGSRAPWM